MKTITTNIATKELIKYREFDRINKPAPVVPFFQCYNVAQVAEWMIDAEVIPALELSICGNKALLTDGNHRVAAADLLDISWLPVKVVYYDSFKELRDTFYKHTIKRFKTVK